ncbi:hypothetical protein MNBD_GAMMA23-2235 [hydrothermal vent metagenome]|uniref:Uncharacterized protein n=1 Tax=hydrothermal vent metagenome TaxID=652676 RepID=A0A3B0ZYH5_9ZZZZ
MKNIILTTGLLLGLSTAAFAASVTIPNTFTAGSPAVAADVNANFSAVKTAVDDNDARISALPSTAVYDYRNYLPTATSMTYNVTGSGACGDTEIRSYVRTSSGTSTDVESTWRETSSGTLCKHRVFRITNTPTERLLKERDNYDTVTGLRTNTYRLDEPITVRTSTMTQGSTFTDASRSYTIPTAGTEVLSGTHVNIATASIETQTVVVPLGSYNNCLKIHENRASNNFGGSNMNRVYWFCQGVGMVKLISNNNGSYKVLELSATTP